MSTTGITRKLAGGLLWAGVLVAASASMASGQLAELDQRCISGGGGAASCRAASDMLDIVTARTLRIAAGGNPVAGTASTIGRRVSAPRIALTARFGAGSLALPELDAPSSESSSLTVGFHGDLVIGLFDGLSPAATVGGVASLDFLASAGTVLLSSSDGFETSSPFTWAAGLRAGILRESFTAPGISLTGMYRRIGTLERGDANVVQDPVHVRLEDVAAWDANLAIGKRISLFGVTAGGGYTRYSAQGRLRVSGGTGAIDTDSDDLDGSRVHLFTNLSWTVMVWNLTGELGWQSSGGALEDGRQPASGASGGGWFGGFSVRLTI